MNIEDLKVPPDRLTVSYDPDDIGFESTEEIQAAEGPLGQDKAIAAMELALDIEQETGFNLLISGYLGSNRNQSLKSTIDRIAAHKPGAPDLGYVYNFSDPSQPRALILPGGKLTELRDDMEEAIKTCRREISRFFEREDYTESIDRLKTDFKAKNEAVDSALQESLSATGLALDYSGSGPTFSAMRDGRKMSAEELDSLTGDQRLDLEGNKKKSEQLLTGWQDKKRELHEDESVQIDQVDRGVVLYTVGPIISKLMAKYCEREDIHHLEPVKIFLDEVQDDIVRNPNRFKDQDGQGWDRYRINILVNNRNSKGAPVIFDYRPNYHNLFGRIDHVFPNAPTDDFMLIRPGSLHMANGGYLVLQARDIRDSLWSWDALKQTLRSGRHQIENIREADSPLPSSTIKPESIPVNIKVVLVATHYDLRVLREADEEFDSYFRVEAEFDSYMPRTSENIREYVSFITGIVLNKGLRPLDKTALARLIDHSSLIADSQERLTTIFQEVTDVITEGNYWAGRRGSNTVYGEDVDRAIKEGNLRETRLKDHYQEYIEMGYKHVTTHGSAVGQVNGLYVVADRFGTPGRITAKVSLGTGQLISVEREASMTGPSHHRAFITLTGYLNGKYGQEIPLSISASISHEQSPPWIDGNSASSAELYSLLSELSGLPVSQGIAVTGAVNQDGDVQAIGGTTYKIEGFFDICQSRGLNGAQGVMVPVDNLKDLLLKDEVIQAVRDGLFHIYQIKTVNEGIEVLTGVPAGEAGTDGKYPEGTVHRLVERRLAEMARTSRDWAKNKESGEHHAEI